MFFSYFRYVVVCYFSAVRSTSLCVAPMETRTRMSASSGEPPAKSKEPLASCQTEPVTTVTLSSTHTQYFN